jgi:hypothetical protein
MNRVAIRTPAVLRALSPSVVWKRTILFAGSVDDANALLSVDKAWTADYIRA